MNIGNVSRADCYAATMKLLAVAQRDTGQSRRCANFLLAWWNSDANGGFPLHDLWNVDRDLKEAMTTVFLYVRDNWEYPTALGLSQEFEDLADRWR